jgi:hypothetical protein
VERITKLVVLHWALGLVLLLESCLFAFSPAQGHAFARSGFPPWLPVALGSAEALAAVLFLVPRAMRLGGWLLLGIFFLAAVIHVLHGSPNVGSLAIYAVAVLLVMDGYMRRASPTSV